MQTQCSGVDTAVNIVCQGVKLQYHVFDILRFNGQWIYHLPLEDRNKYKLWAMSVLTAINPHYHLVPSWYYNHDRLKIFEDVLLKGGEGVMFKNKTYAYEIGKRVDHQLKLKRFIDFDAFITGSTPATPGKGWEGMIGGFEVSCMAGDKPIHVASCSAMTLEDRRAASLPDGSLNPDFLNRVIEVRCQQLTSRSKRGRHAVMVRYRPDKTPDMCGMDQIKDSDSEMMADV